MRPLPKNHFYNLYLEKETADLMVFKNCKGYTTTLFSVVSAFFWAAYVLGVMPLPEADPYKITLTYFCVGMASLSLIMALQAINISETLTLRKINSTMIYEYQTMGGQMGWKKFFKDFSYIHMFLEYPEPTEGQSRKTREAVWHFELIGAGNLRVSINPKGIILLSANQEEKALAFAEKISRFMNIPVDRS